MRSSTYRPLGPLIQIYKAQARGALMYGAELWGHTVSCSLSITENNFIRQIVALPSSTPLLPLRMDLGLRPIADELGLRPIVFWRTLWSTEELSSYRAELREFLTHPKALQIPWIKYIKKSCMGLGLPDLWSDPANASLRIPRRALVSAYHEQKLAMALDCKNEGSLTSVFAQSKDSYRLERVLDAMSPVLARKLFLQWRYGTLPLRSYTWSWSTLPSTKLCPTCVGAEESDLHVVLFCPTYKAARKYWLLPLIRNLGFREYLPVYRILKTDVSGPIVFALAKFLTNVWHIRTRILKLQAPI
ncbi:hypothetical protein NDU88_006035 [Pleurodeles waltl]|uniref:Reverse transcriptase zinc-binding domain-containing protein n=1 Tax=Pleurodeles waltl TaxID=8319 RepID=A0AAV7NQN7_PLEWA|nr:hypothetical protein NDU88_006035 [Pleurodeles waltl]